jgi:hypothetical protein
VNWTLLALLGLLFTVLDLSWMPVLRVGGVWPATVPVLVTFVALWASRPAALWAPFLLGLFVDLCRPEVGIDASGELRAIRVLGPDAVGFLFGAFALQSLRRVLLRRNPFAIAAATLVTTLLAALVWGAIWSVRAFWGGTVMPWSAGEAIAALGQRCLESGATALVAVPLSWLLLRLMPWWGFPGTAFRR